MQKRVWWFAMLGALVLVTAACDWSMVGFNAGRSGFNFFEKAITPTNVGALTETWRAAPGSGTSAPVVGGGRLFVTTQPVGTTAGGLSAYNATGAGCAGAAPATCSPIWSKTFETQKGSHPPISPPLLTRSYVSASGTLDIRSLAQIPRNTSIYTTNVERSGGSFDPASGLAATGETRDGAAPSASAGDAIFGYRRDAFPYIVLVLYYAATYVLASVPADEGSSFSIRGQEGIYGNPDFIGSAPAVADGNLFITRPGELQTYDAHGRVSCAQVFAWHDNVCTPMWTGTLSHPGTFDGMPAVARDRVYAPALDGAVEVFDSTGCGATTCAPLWTAHAGSSHIAPVSVTDDTLFAASDDGHLYAFDAAGCGAATCQPKWSADLGSAVHAPSVAGSVLFTGSEDGHLYAFDANGCGHPTCTPLWTGNVGAPIRTAPVISDGRVFVTDTAGTVHAFGLAQ